MMMMAMALVGAFASASATDTALALASTVALTGPNRLDVDAVVSQCLCDSSIGYELLLCIENQSSMRPQSDKLCQVPGLHCTFT